MCGDHMMPYLTHYIGITSYIRAQCGIDLSGSFEGRRWKHLWYFFRQSHIRTVAQSNSWTRSKSNEEAIRYYTIGRLTLLNCAHMHIISVRFVMLHISWADDTLRNNGICNIMRTWLGVLNKKYRKCCHCLSPKPDSPPPPPPSHSTLRWPK